MALVTQTKFLSYQGAFYQKVNASDKTIELGVVAVTASSDFLTDFTGSNAKTVTWYQLPALFEHNIDVSERDRFGISETQSGTIYLSPIQLEGLFGTHVLDHRTLLVKIDDHEFLVEPLIYLERLYSTCIAIQFNLKEKIRG